MVNNKLHDRIKKIFKDKLNENVLEINCIVKRRQAYKVTCKEKIFRIDLEKRYLQNINEHILAFNSGINVAKILYYSIDPPCKISEWIDGYVIKTATNEIAAKFGEQIGKINSIKKDDLFLTFEDAKKRNMVLTPDKKFYIIDIGGLKYSKSVVSSVVICLLWRRGIIKNRPKKIDLFLLEYSKYCGNTKIVTIIKNELNNRNK